MNEHRIAPRRRILKVGSIEFAGSGIACTVRNLSETGAALEVVTPLFIPDRFTLVVSHADDKRYALLYAANGSSSWKFCSAGTF